MNACTRRPSACALLGALAVLWLISAMHRSHATSPPAVQAPPAIVSEATGSIGGQPHLAQLLERNVGYPPAELSIAVYREDPVQRVLLVQSPWFVAHQRWYALQVDIEGDSVMFGFGGSGGCCEQYTMRYQFAPRAGEFRLIGTESSSMGFREDDAAGATNASDTAPAPAPSGSMISFQEGTSTNRLTGDVLHWSVQRPSSSAEPYKDDVLVAGAPATRRESRSRLEHRSVLLLKDFDPNETP